MRARLAFRMLATASAILLGGSPAVAQSGARVTGTVSDSITGAPLADAVVQLVARTDRNRSATTRTDSAGRFAFDSVEPGPYVAGFLHPRLDSLYIAAPVREIDVPRTGAVQLRLFVPSRRALVSAHCGPTAATDSSGVFLGRVRPARDGAQGTKASIAIRWVELTVGNGIRRQLPIVEAETDSRGAFAVCGLPAETRLLVQAWSPRDTSGLIELEIPASGLLLRDLHVGAYQSVVIASPAGPDSATGIVDSIMVLRGTGRLRGTVRGENAMPVAGATVRVRGSESAATTDPSGSFTLGALPTGTHSLEATAIGFQPARVSVDITDGDASPADVVLRPVGPVLDTVRVFGTRDRIAPWRSEFDGRRKLGLGRFLDEAAIEKRDPMTVADLLSSMPGVTIRTGLYSSRSMVMLRSISAGGYCVPTFYIDGIPMDVAEGGIDALVSARQVRAVELYRSKVLTPSAFAARSGCGTIVIWTGMRG